MTAGQLFCFGFGYCAQALARRLAENGWSVGGTCRSEEQRARLKGEGWAAEIFDGARQMADAAATLSGATHVLVSIPPGPQGDVVINLHAETLARARLDWVGYLSTTGVYGDTGGARVDETAELMPSSPRSLRRVAAEAAWTELVRSRGVPVHVFRLPGIYGPGRCALDTVRSGKARRIDKPGHRFSRIHVDDIAATLAASMERPEPGAVYNVCDDEAAPPADVTAFACELLGEEPPPVVPFSEAAREMSEMALSFWNDNRTVDNAKIKRDLGVTLAHPTYRDGLRAIHAAGG